MESFIYDLPLKIRLTTQKLWFAVEYDDNITQAIYYINSGANIRSWDELGKNLLFIAHTANMTELLLRAGLDANWKIKTGEKKGQTAIFDVPHSQEPVKKMEKLIEFGADLTIQDYKGRVAREYLLNSQNSQIINYIESLSRTRKKLIEKNCNRSNCFEMNF